MATLPTVLALLVAAIVATGCGGDEPDVSATTEPGISEITSDALQYVGQNVDLRGEVSEIFFLPGGFLLDESEGGGDDLIVEEEWASGAAAFGTPSVG